ncbi:hypothetical protein [Steroidobacter sp.]|uniref:hypothetical protein n=1 Tax=Steroidobacter sp. TaxID=1978227 RepID=UPI001A386A02|nr:hypothetical protein [Steroidobacter sp.]MBL8264963.1 hypothetical protein [Steroidobacter sp.]
MSQTASGRFDEQAWQRDVDRLYRHFMNRLGVESGAFRGLQPADVPFEIAEKSIPELQSARADGRMSARGLGSGE